MDEKNRENFLKIYSNLPLKIREEIILDLGEGKGPVTWNVVYIEVRNKTKIGEVILQKLKGLEII